VFQDFHYFLVSLYGWTIENKLRWTYFLKYDDRVRSISFLARAPDLSPRVASKQQDASAVGLEGRKEEKGSG